jgi:hypothetical protein
MTSSRIPLSPPRPHSYPALAPAGTRVTTLPGLALLPLLLLPLLAPGSLDAQPSEHLAVQTIHVQAGHPVEFTFADAGTGATGYRIEFSINLGADAIWEEDLEAVLTALGGGQFHVSSPESLADQAFYRVVALGVDAGPIVISFATATIEATEGDTAMVVIHFSAPFTGTVRYSVSGSAEAGDYDPLSGEIHVQNATSATLPVSLIDNDSADPLRHLTLTLESGGGLVLGSRNQITILIDDNDADWQGLFSNENVTLAFTLHITELQGTHQATLRGGRGGFFPVDPTPATIVWTDSQFELVVDEIPFEPGTTSFDAPLRLRLELSAADAIDGQVVSSREIEGAASFQIEYPAKPHLNTDSVGVFLLTRTPLVPSNVAAPLSPAP